MTIPVSWTNTLSCFFFPSAYIAAVPSRFEIDGDLLTRESNAIVVTLTSTSGLSKDLTLNLGETLDILRRLYLHIIMLYPYIHVHIIMLYPYIHVHIYIYSISTFMHAVTIIL